LKGNWPRIHREQFTKGDLMNKTLIFLLMLFVLPQSSPPKADARILAADSRCHYIVQGARMESLRTLYQQPGCMPFSSYSTKERLKAAVKLYRKEIDKIWPNKKPLHIQQEIDEQEKSR